MDKDELEIKKVFAGIAKNLSKKKWQCIVNGCTDDAINSHLLQRHGVLSHIIEEGHCYELHPIDIFRWQRDKLPFQFKLKGLQEAISLDLFCNHHDTDIFLPIETGVVDYSNYNNQILLSYRTVCAEIRKKEVSIERYRRYLGSEILKASRRDMIELIPDIIDSNETAINDLMVYKNLLENEINTPTNSFYFVHESYPISRIYASTCFTIASKEETADFERTLDNVFGHIIPTDTGSEFIFGYHKEHVNDAIRKFTDGWHGLSIYELGEKLTGWFTLIESWGMSPSLHDSISQEAKDKYFKLLEKSFNKVEQDPNVEFNMFAGVL